MADTQFGGRITLDFAGTKLVQCEADIKLKPGVFVKDHKTNQDGSTAYMLKPKSPAVEIRPRGDIDIDWDALMLTQGNLTIVEETNGRTHLFTATQMVGDRDENLSNGEVEGLQFAGGRYRVLNG